MDAERGRLVAALRRAGVVTTVVMEPGIGPTLLGHNGAGDPFVTDGWVAVIVLTQLKRPSPRGVLRAQRPGRHGQRRTHGHDRDTRGAAA